MDLSIGQGRLRAAEGEHANFRTREAFVHSLAQSCPHSTVLVKLLNALSLSLHICVMGVARIRNNNSCKVAPARHLINISIIITGLGTPISFSYELDSEAHTHTHAQNLFYIHGLFQVLTYTSCDTKEVPE